MRRARGAEEARYRREHPDEGLRERKRRLTRQTISDAATTMFATRGFDNVTVSDVAARVGVSEKTIYNYFPTKESMVLDAADDTLAELARALRERRPDESLTEAVLRALKSRHAPVRRGLRRHRRVPPDVRDDDPDDGRVASGVAGAVRPARSRSCATSSRCRRASTPVTPRSASPARALVGLVQLALESRVRWIEEGLRGEALRSAVSSDINRAARLLETGPVVVRAADRRRPRGQPGAGARPGRRAGARPGGFSAAPGA